MHAVHAIKLAFGLGEGTTDPNLGGARLPHSGEAAGLPSLRSQGARVCGSVLSFATPYGVWSSGHRVPCEMRVVPSPSVCPSVRPEPPSHLLNSLYTVCLASVTPTGLLGLARQRRPSAISPLGMPRPARLDQHPHPGLSGSLAQQPCRLPRPQLSASQAQLGTRAQGPLRSLASAVRLAASLGRACRGLARLPTPARPQPRPSSLVPPPRSSGSSFITSLCQPLAPPLRPARLRPSAGPPAAPLTPARLVRPAAICPSCHPLRVASSTSSPSVVLPRRSPSDQSPPSRPIAPAPPGPSPRMCRPSRRLRRRPSPCRRPPSPSPSASAPAHRCSALPAPVRQPARVAAVRPDPRCPRLPCPPKNLLHSRIHPPRLRGRHHASPA